MSEKKRETERRHFEAMLAELRPVASDVDREQVFFDAGKVFAEKQRKNPWKSAATFAMAMSLVLSVLLVVQQSRLTHRIAVLQADLQSNSVPPREKPSQSVDAVPEAEDANREDDDSIRFAELDSQFALIAMRRKLVVGSSGVESHDTSEQEIVSDVFDPQQSYRFDIIKQLKKEILQTGK